APEWEIAGSSPAMTGWMGAFAPAKSRNTESRIDSRTLSMEGWEVAAQAWSPPAAALSLQRLVADAVGLVGVRAPAPLQVLGIGVVVAFEPDDLAVPLEGEDVRGDAVEEPAVVADDDAAA